MIINKFLIYKSEYTVWSEYNTPKNYLIRIPTIRPSLELYKKIYLGSYKSKLPKAYYSRASPESDAPEPVR